MKKTFDTVIKINGVGPKVALAICSRLHPSSFAQIVNENDVSMLKEFLELDQKVQVEF